MNIPLVSIFYDISSSILPPLRVKSWLYHAVPMTSPITRYPLVICDSLLLTIAIKSLLIYPAITSLNMVMFHRLFVCLPVPKRIPAAAGCSRLQPSDMASSSRDFWVSRTTTKLSSEKISWEHEEFPHVQNPRRKHGKTTYTVILLYQYNGNCTV